jgi:ParB family transcriptional regulator, chromosome partitioning protein
MTPKTLTSSSGVAQVSSRPSPTHVPGHAAYIEVFWEVDEDAEDPEDDEQRVAEATYVCLDPVQYGHLEPPQESSRAQQAADVDEDAPQEAAKAERRRVLANNKAWRTAETVRREWLKNFATRKTAPKGATGYVFAELAQGDNQLRGQHGETACVRS